MKLFVKILDENLKKKYENRKNYSTDSGFDLFARIPVEVNNNAKIPLGIACAPAGNKVQGYYLYPRSSISKTPLRLANSVGIIDWGYRGEICAVVDNIDKENTFMVDTEKSYFQLCAPDLTPLEIEFVEDLHQHSSERGEGGFGSTDNK